MIPKLIYGTCRTMLNTKPNSDPNTGPSTESLVESAIKSGILAFDSALHDGYNEQELAIAIQKNSIDRSELWLQSKYSPEAEEINDSSEVTASKISTSLNKSLRILGTDYLDSYIIHTPFISLTNYDSSKLTHSLAKDLEVWQVMESLYSQNMVKHIGYSHLPLIILKYITQNSKIQPHFIQNSWPFDLAEEAHLLQYCLENAITYQAFKILDSKLLQSEKITSIAQKYNVSNAQVMIKFAQELGMQVIFGSKNENHMHENTNLNFALTLEDVKTISTVTPNPEAFISIYSKIQNGELTSVINVIDSIISCVNEELVNNFAKVGKYITKLDPSSLAEIIAAKGTEVIDYLIQYNANFSAMNYKHFYHSNIIAKQGEIFVTELLNKLDITGEKLLLASLDLDLKYIEQALTKADLQQLSDDVVIAMLNRQGTSLINSLDKNNNSIVKLIQHARNIEESPTEILEGLSPGNWKDYVNAMKTPKTAIDFEYEIRILEEKYIMQVKNLIDFNQLEDKEIKILLKNDKILDDFNKSCSEFVEAVQKTFLNSGYDFFYSTNSICPATLYLKYGIKTLQFFSEFLSKFSSREIIYLFMEEKSVSSLKDIGVNFKNLELKTKSDLHEMLDTGISVEEIISLKKEGAKFTEGGNGHALGTSATLIEYATGVEIIPKLKEVGIEISLNSYDLYHVIAKTGTKFIPALKAEGVDFNQLDYDWWSIILAIKHGKPLVSALKEVGLNDSFLNYMERDLSSLNEREILDLYNRDSIGAKPSLTNYKLAGIDFSKLDNYQFYKLTTYFPNATLTEFKDAGIDFSKIINEESGRYDYRAISNYELLDAKEAGVNFSELNINHLLTSRYFDNYSGLYGNFGFYKTKDINIDDLKILKNVGVDFTALTLTNICNVVMFSGKKLIPILKDSGVDFTKFNSEDFNYYNTICSHSYHTVYTTEKIVKCVNDQTCYNKCIEAEEVDFAGCYTNYTNTIHELEL